MLRGAGALMLTLLSGYGFDERQGPFLVVDELEHATTRRRRANVRGAPLTLSAGEQRFCTGTFDLMTYEAAPCPERAPVKGELETCYQCFRRTGFNPSFYNVPRETISPQQRVYNERPHVVYLAFFAEGCVKVGISSQDRVFARWRGQGARLATLLASVDDAYTAREVEQRVARDAGLPEALRGARKRRLLNVPLCPRAAARTLEQERERIARRLDLPLVHAKVHDLTPDYLGVQQLDLPITDMSDEPTPSISGVGVGMIGDVLLVEEGRRQFMLSLKELIGRVIVLEPVARGNRRRPTAGQLGFDFS